MIKKLIFENETNHILLKVRYLWSLRCKLKLCFCYINILFAYGWVGIRICNPDMLTVLVYWLIWLVGNKDYYYYYYYCRWWRSYVPKDVSEDLSHSDTRLSVQLNGFEMHVYNRSHLYQAGDKRAGSWAAWLSNVLVWPIRLIDFLIKKNNNNITGS